MSAARYRCQDAFPALVLAAGASRRMGRSKAMLSWGGGTLLERALVQGRCLSTDVRVMTGCYHPVLRYRCRRQPQSWLHTPDWEEGMAASLRRGVASLPASARGVFVVLVDQPLVSLEALVDLGQRARTRPWQALAADHGGRAGVPAYLPRWLWPALLALEGDRGAARLLAAAGATTLDLKGAGDDIDTPADWRRLRNPPATPDPRPEPPG